MQLKMTKIDSSVERHIITAMIVSTHCLNEIVPIYKPEYFHNSFARTIAEWCVSYHLIYKKAPLASIKEIYENEKDYVKEDDAQVISDLLNDISEKYSITTSFNAEYALDNAFHYFKRRELQQTVRDAQAMLERGDITKAEEVLSGYNKVVRATSGWVNPFVEEEINKYYTVREDTSDFFKLSGYLGDYMGVMRPRWLIGITAPFKRGKTNFLIEIIANAILQEKHVVLFSLEMSEHEMKDRIYRRMLNVVEENDPVIKEMHDDYAEFNIPILDCFRNQNDTCTKPCRVSTGRIRLQDGTLPEYIVNMAYRPCSICSRLKTNDYIAAHWWKRIKSPTLEMDITRDKLKNLTKYYKNFCRIKSYPQNSASINEFRRDLEILYTTEGFTAEIMCADYAEITRASNSKVIGVEKEDMVWLEYSQLMSEFNVLGFVPTQGNKDSLTAEHVKQQHTSRWIGKLGHVDGMVCLNQMNSEKKEHIMRISWMLHRHKAFSENDEAYILQNIAASQFALNSGPISFKSNGKTMVQVTE
jgi:hypothetical protein